MAMVTVRTNLTRSRLAEQTSISFIKMGSVWLKGMVPLFILYNFYEESGERT